MAAAHEAGEADDLAGPDGQSHVRQAILSAHVVENQKILTGVDISAMRFHRVQGTPDDHRDEPVLVGALALDHGDLAAVAQDRDAIGNVENLVKVMRDEDDPHALAGQIADEPKEEIGLRLVEGRRRLIEQEDMRLLAHCLGDRDLLPVGDAEVAQSLLDGQIEIELGEEFAGPLVHRGIVKDSRSLARLGAKKDVGGHREIEMQFRILIDDRNARCAALGGIEHAERLAADDDLPAVGRLRARQDLHQRGFAGSVLADKRMHLAAGYVEINIVQRARAQETLGHAPRPESE